MIFCKNIYRKIFEISVEIFCKIYILLSIINIILLLFYILFHKTISSVEYKFYKRKDLHFLIIFLFSLHDNLLIEILLRY